MFSRRQYLGGIGSIGIATLAGCTGGGGGGDDYPSDDITFIVPSSAGSGFDAYARNVASPWASELGGDVEFVVENVTEAGGISGMNRLHQADSDGYTVGIVNVPGYVATQSLQDVEYDLTELTHLGRIHRGTYLLIVNPDTGVETWEDLQEMDEVQWGVRLGTTGSYGSIITADTMGLNVEFISGYEGGPEVRTAAAQGEVDAALFTASSSRDFIEDGRLLPVLQYTDEPVEWLPNDPPLTEEIDTFAGFQNLNLSRIISAPPDLDDDVAETLETTLWDAMHTEELESWSDEADRPLTGRIRGDEAAEVVDGSFELVTEYQDTLEEYLGN